MKISILIANRIISLVSASIFSIFIIWIFKDDYLKYVEVTSACLVVLGFSFQWSLLDIVNAADEKIEECLYRYRTRQKYILLCTLIIASAILLGGNSNDKLSLVSIGAGFILYTISNEGFSHIATRLSLLKINIYLNVFKIITITIFFHFELGGKQSFVFLLVICAIANISGQYLIFKTKFIEPIKKYDFQFSWENFSRAVSFLIAGVSLQIDRLFTRAIDNVSANGLAYIISDYSNLMLGFMASIVYWYAIGKYISNKKIIFFYSISIYIVVCLFSLVALNIGGINLYKMEANKLTDYIGFEGVLIVLLSIPSIIKTFVIEPLAMTLNISKKVVWVNMCYLVAYVSFILFLREINALYLILIKGVLSIAAGLFLINLIRRMEVNKIN